MHLGTGEDLRPLAVGADMRGCLERGYVELGLASGGFCSCLLSALPHSAGGQVRLTPLLDLCLRGPSGWFKNAHVDRLACQHPDLLVERSRKKQVSPCGLLRGGACSPWPEGRALLELEHAEKSELRGSEQGQVLVVSLEPPGPTMPVGK